jgi:hypothetical protein
MPLLPRPRDFCGIDVKTYLDCIPCFVRQALLAARSFTTDPAMHERVMRDVLEMIGEADWSCPPPQLAQRIHRRLRELTGLADPYLGAKQRFNRLALDLLPELRARVAASEDPLALAIRLAIAGNVIDLGVKGDLSENDVHLAIDRTLAEPFAGSIETFTEEIQRSQKILYLADNAGEIVFDGLLIAQMPTERVTLAVRGGPILNDATRADVREAGLEGLVEVIDNGSDAPGTVLADCDEKFRRAYDEADMIVSKGQGNFETLSEAPGNIFFLLKVKCPVIAEHTVLPLGTHVLCRSGEAMPRAVQPVTEA